MTTIYPSKEDPTKYPELEKDQTHQPYSIYTRPTNIKSRWLYCQFCKYKVMSDLGWAKCGMCSKQLITISRDKLAGRDS